LRTTPSFAYVRLDASHRTVRFAHPQLQLDLGGFGKGYALDCAAEIVRAHHVSRALLHGGTSSVIALGHDQHDQPWPIGIRNPFAIKDTSLEVAQVRLCDQGFSSSAALAPGQAESDLIDPQTGQPLTNQAACAVIAPTAAEAEILSTALLCMGKEQAATYIRNKVEAASCRVYQLAWISGSTDAPIIEWFP
jgi:thiamine biosynthesis lipoprotein